MSIITDSTMKFIDVWDGEELAQLFYDDRRLVPDEPKLLANWLTVITRMDEGSINPAIFADVVYISNPSQRVIVRFKGIVRNVRLELPQLRNGQMEFNASTVETLALHFGNTVDRLGFSRQVRRIEELRKAVTGLLVGGSKIIWNGMDHEHWGKQAYEFRRGIRTGKKPVQVELLQGKRLLGIPPNNVRVGDEVEIPIWIDIWFPPAGLNIRPIPSATFDRIVVLSRGN